jgi:CBS-domain-containing membrane protein
VRTDPGDRAPPHEHAGHIPAILQGLGRRLGLRPLELYHAQSLLMGLFAFVNGAIAMGVIALVAWGTGAPFLFPSLGPTAFLVFYMPMHPSSSPRNTLLGHLVGVAAGYVSLRLFGLADQPSALLEGVSLARVGAAALSLALTNGGMVWARVPHPPAGATTLIVSLGLMSAPFQLGVLLLGVTLLVAQGFVINRIAGIEYPLWAARVRPRP